MEQFGLRSRQCPVIFRFSGIGERHTSKRREYCCTVVIHVLRLWKAVQFAQSYDLRLAVKGSGHNLLGRSTAKNSLLIHTHKLQNINFTDNFVVDGKSKGTAMTVGSGVNLSILPQAIRVRFTSAALPHRRCRWRVRSRCRSLCTLTSSRASCG